MCLLPNFGSQKADEKIERASEAIDVRERERAPNIVLLLPQLEEGEEEKKTHNSN